jgi:hypothetical protein
MEETAVMSKALVGDVSYEELDDILRKTNKEKPKKADTARLRQVLRNNPDLWQEVCGMARQAISGLLEGDSFSVLSRELYKQEIDGIRRHLGYDDAPMVEQLLIEQVCLCWLRLGVLEYKYSFLTRDMTIAQADFWERRLSATQRRFLRAVETLARVRKITRRTLALQVNIAAQGGQQVNVAGDVEG